MSKGKDDQDLIILVNRYWSGPLDGLPRLRSATGLVMQRGLCGVATSLVTEGCRDAGHRGEPRWGGRWRTSTLIVYVRVFFFRNRDSTWLFIGVRYNLDNTASAGGKINIKIQAVSQLDRESFSRLLLSIEYVRRTEIEHSQDIFPWPKQKRTITQKKNQ